MDITVPGSSTQGVKTVLHPVSGLATTTEGYTVPLGGPPQTDEPYYDDFRDR